MMTFSQSSAPRRDPMIDPNLSQSFLLSVPPMPRSRPALEPTGNADPIARFYNDQPWSTEHMRNSSIPTGRMPLSNSNMEYGPYRERIGSDYGSVTQRSDSGYHTQHPRSVVSNPPDRSDQELPRDMFRVENMHVTSVASDPGDVLRVEGGADKASVYSGRSTGKEFRCTQHGCREVSKCKSDHKKHMLKHEKPWKCHVHPCKRNGRGFTTTNDLKRHQKSVHGMGATENSYKCASESCRSKEKIWPRLDNFKQHISRMHLNEDEQDLIQRSHHNHLQPDTISSEEPSQVTLDSALAGIGERRFSSSNEFDDPNPGISLTPDQDIQWNSAPTFDPSSSHDFAMDVDESNANPYQPRKANIDAVYGLLNQSLSFDPPSGIFPQTGSHQRLDALAALASAQASPEKREIQSLPRLSNAPQTKADQQQALKKLSEMVFEHFKSSSSDERIDLGNIVMRVLYNATDQGEFDASSSREVHSNGDPTGQHAPPRNPKRTLTKQEALKGLQAILNSIKQVAPVTVNRAAERPHKKMKVCDRAGCSKVLARSCDMKKHMKRHDRPYGCTYPKCHKRFGAKSDWKRHEMGQHYQVESFRCQLTSPASQIPCGEIFYRSETFKKHLAAHHKSDDEQIASEVKVRRMGKNGQGRFWCGFCERIVTLTERRGKAWAERFDHIDNHFSKEKKGIEEWFCPDAKKTKGQALNEKEKEDLDMEGWDDQDTDDSDETPAQTQSQEPVHEMPATQIPIPPSESTTPSSYAASSSESSACSNETSKKRQADVDDVEPAPEPKRLRIVNLMYCCSCQGGPYDRHNYANCMMCEHHWCGNCEAYELETCVGREGS
ncbi:hypothetical protein P154DRAFT_579665 [Amniculicola lignicola CBS 123094]|uniref:C2H2-type domain-containing protein n=1 Tax=Amniculicola lignicola CBS 123094 TaxID=1392246 RepID=A0A6A5W4F3_9PLEO|nr:hypothetical protein P154DRAFT_579665 [Amniculicola lignicola CBS 123094]